MLSEPVHRCIVKPVNSNVGAAIAQYRKRAGLSMAQLSAGISSKSMLSMIESGKRAPSPELLTKYAQRLGTTAEELAGGLSFNAVQSAEARLAQAQFLVVEDNRQEAAPLFAECLDFFEMADLPNEAALSAYGLAQCRESSGHLEESLAFLQRAKNHADRTNNFDFQIRAAASVSMMLRTLGDLAAAYECLQDARNQIPLELRTSGSAARLTAILILVLVERGDFVSALSLAEESLETLSAEENAVGRAQVLWNASFAAEANRQSDRALRLAHEALALLEGSAIRSEVPRLRSCIAWLFMRMSPPDTKSARAQLELATKELGPNGSIFNLASVSLELARVCVTEGDLEQARIEVDKAVSLQRKMDAPSEVAHALLLRARIAAAGQDLVTLKASLKEARELLSSARSSRATSLAWRELGDALSVLGLQSEANLCYQFALTDAGINGNFDFEFENATLGS